MLRRIDRLADLGTTIITLSGGEPMLHPPRCDRRTHPASARDRDPDYKRAPAHARRISAEPLGARYLQISIDNLLPDEVRRKV